MSPVDTKSTILDAAEALFAEHGFAGTSLRQLTARAGVNLAAVNYHFGSKEELAKAVLTRRIAPIQRERLRRLAVLADADVDDTSVEDLVRAFVEPALLGPQSCAGSPVTGPHMATAHDFCQLFGRISVEQPPFLREFLGEQFGDLGRRFVAMLRRVAPGIDATSLWWRLHFVVGAMAHTMKNAAAIRPVSGGLCDPDDVPAVVEQLVAFAVGGLTAKPAGARRRPTSRLPQRQPDRAPTRAKSPRTRRTAR